MSIQGTIGNVGSFASNTIESGIAYAKGILNNVGSTVSATLGNIWSGGFAGISKAEVEGTLIPAIENYCKTIEDKIAEFNADADLAQTFAGTEMQGAAKEFVEAVKELLQAYVSTMRAEIARVNQAYEAWETGTQSVSSNATSDASEIRNAASNIKLD